MQGVKYIASSNIRPRGRLPSSNGRTSIYDQFISEMSPIVFVQRPISLAPSVLAQLKYQPQELLENEFNLYVYDFRSTKDSN